MAGVLRRFRAAAPPPRRFLAAIIIPAVLTPLILWPLDVDFLPVLVEDYLAVHFTVFGLMALAMIAAFGGFRRGGFAIACALALPVALFGIVVFGQVLDRYAASFVPVAARIPVGLAMAYGAVPFMLVDTALTQGGRTPLWRLITVRALALASLGHAVALDFEG